MICCVKPFFSGGVTIRKSLMIYVSSVPCLKEYMLAGALSLFFLPGYFQYLGISCYMLGRKKYLKFLSFQETNRRVLRISVLVALYLTSYQLGNNYKLSEQNDSGQYQKQKLFITCYISHQCTIG